MKTFARQLIVHLGPAARWLGFPYYLLHRGPER
jgi:hypothetical protein